MDDSRTVQRDAALAKANGHRRARAAIKQQLARARPADVSHAMLAGMLLGPDGIDPSIATAMVDDVLRWPYRSSPKRRAKIMRAVRCHPARALGDLTPRQLEVLALGLVAPLDAPGETWPPPA